MAGKSKITFESLLADRRTFAGVDGMWLAKEAQEQPDETQFAQDFSNLAFQFIQDRAPALMKYMLGFEVVDRSENGTRAVGIFGFKIDGQYYYVPTFFMNSQIKGVDSILSKSTNSFVPLTEEWVNYIINRKANELGGEAKENRSADGTGAGSFENPNLDFLRHPTSGPLGWHSKTASHDDDKPYTLRQAWSAMKSRVEEMLEKDAEFSEDLVGTMCRLRGMRRPFGKQAESPVRKYLSETGGPRAERTFLGALRNVKMANAALEFYVGPSAFHVDRYSRKGCYALRKEAEETEERRPKIEIVGDAITEDEAREVLENGFTVRDRRPDESKSSVVSVDYEKNFQNPDRSGVYNVLVDGGDTVKAYVMASDRLFHAGADGTMVVYFPDNKQVISARNSDIVCDGGCVDGFDKVYSEADGIADCRLHGNYLFIGSDGTTLPEFNVTGISGGSGQRPVVHGSFSYSSDARPGYLDDRMSFATYSICGVELADFDGRPKFSGGSVVLPRGWKALPVETPWDAYGYDGLSVSEYGAGGGDDASGKGGRARTYRLGTLNTLSADLRKEGAARLDLRSDGSGFYYSFDGRPFTQPAAYKSAAIDLITKMGLGWEDAKSLLKSASSCGRSVCLVKMAQIAPSRLVGVDPAQLESQIPSSDPYTGMPMYDMPYYDATEMPFNGVDESVSMDNEPGENIGGDISRQSGSGSSGDPTGDAEFDEEAMSIAQNAARIGQKHVFDKAAIGGLAKVYDTGAVIDSYIPEFMTAVDRLGRTLFLFYWKHSDFIDRYGTDDVIEMEDLLRSTFKQLGKLTMDLRMKSVGGGEGDAGNDLLR